MKGCWKFYGFWGFHRKPSFTFKPYWKSIQSYCKPIRIHTMTKLHLIYQTTRQPDFSVILDPVETPNSTPLNNQSYSKRSHGCLKPNEQLFCSSRESSSQYTKISEIHRLQRRCRQCAANFAGRTEWHGTCYQPTINNVRSTLVETVYITHQQFPIPEFHV